MALNFPANPNTGDTYTSNNVSWRYDGNAWNIITSSISIASSFLDLSDTPSSYIPNYYVRAKADGSGLEFSPIAAGGDVDYNTILNKPDLNFYIAADDSTIRTVSVGESIQFIGGTNVTTTSDAEGNITINATASGGSSTFSGLTEASTASLTIDKIYEPAMMMFRVDNSGTTAYTFNSHYSGNNPTIIVLSGTTVAFDLTAINGHPFEIQDGTSSPYNTGLVHVATDGTVSTGASAQGKDSGTLYWRIPESISGGYRYQCQNHVAMVGAITVKRLSSL